MAYIQTIVMQKAGSNWETEFAALTEIENDISNQNYLDYSGTYEAKMETHQLDDETQTFTIVRTFTNKSDFDTFEDHVLNNYGNPKTVLESLGWTVTISFQSV